MQGKSAWQHQVFTSAASTKGTGEKADSGIQTPLLPQPQPLCVTANQSGLSELQFAPLPKDGFRSLPKSLWA